MNSKKSDNIANYLNKLIFVKFVGGKTLTAILRKYDEFDNLMLEYPQDKDKDTDVNVYEDGNKNENKNMVYCCGKSLCLVFPLE